MSGRGIGCESKGAYNRQDWQRGQRMRGAILIAASFLLPLPAHAEILAAKATTVFLLEDQEHHAWCAYSAKSAWNADVQNLQAMTVATLTYSNGRITQIDRTETDETGDWTVYDNYTLDEHGHVARLSRTINVLPDDISVFETFMFSNGQAKKTGTAQKKLSTGVALKSHGKEWIPKIAITTRAEDFPFSPYIGQLHPSGKTCVKQKQLR